LGDEDDELDVKLVDVLAKPALWWSLVLLFAPFMRHFYLVIREKAYAGAGFHRTVRELLTDGGPDGSGPRFACTAAMYGLIIDTLAFVYGFPNPVEMAQAGLVALDVGFGMGGFTLMLVILGMIVHACEKDQEPYKIVQQLVVKLDRSFKGASAVKSQTLTSAELIKALRVIFVPWTIHQPRLYHLDVRHNTVIGPSMVHFIFLLLGCNNITVLNGLHAFILMKELPEKGVIIVIQCFDRGQKSYIKKIGLLNPDDSNLVIMRDGKPFNISSPVGSAGHCKQFLMIHADKAVQERVRKNIQDMEDLFPPDHPKDYFTRPDENDDDVESEEELEGSDAEGGGGGGGGGGYYEPE
jgi:hypothetical protein